MIIERRARPTLTPIELDIGDELHFTLVNGQTRRIRILKTAASVYRSNRDQPGRKGPVLVELHMMLQMEIDGHHVNINRWVGNQKSFYEPWTLFGMQIWFDACDKLFDHLEEVHGPCKPRKNVRLAVQDATLRLCPVLLHPWCPLPEGTLRIEDTYEGSDCWMGPYFGFEAHGGVDINHPAGTPIWTPFAVDTQYMSDSLRNPDVKNLYWNASKTWPDGSTWYVRVAHPFRSLVPPHTPVDAGVHVLDGAGVMVGLFEHSHFVFGIAEAGQSEAEQILLDAWILFWQMYRDRDSTQAGR